MTKDESTQAGVQMIQDGVKQALDQAFDNGVQSVPASPALFTQEDLDAAVAKAQSLDAEQLKAAQDQAIADHDTLQSALDSITAKEQIDSQALQALQGSIAAVQQSLDAIKALIFAQ